MSPIEPDHVSRVPDGTEARHASGALGIGPFERRREQPAQGAIRSLPRVGERRPTRSRDASLARLGPLEVRLACSASEVRRAQRLRYQVFYEEMSAVPSANALRARRDVDDYDPICDHLIVVDHDAPRPFGSSAPKVVGTYRLLPQDVAQRHFGFYTAGEYEIAPLLARHSGLRFLELGRSCVLKSHRNKHTIGMLWQGLSAYLARHRIDVMIGCASLEGTDPAQLALPLSFLHHHARAPEGWRVRARAERHVAMDMLPPDAISPRAAMRSLPPLVKGYLRAGATFGDGAVIDRQFGTIDVFVVMPVSAVDPRYADHFGSPAGGRP